jgi:hypothetical protein
MDVKSPAFQDGQEIPRKYTCQGDDVSPALQIDSVPVGTKSLALIVDDPDAPNGTFYHWLAWNLAPTVTEIPEGAGRGGDPGPLRDARQGKNGFDDIGYRGPCPPSGRHRYRFNVFALKEALDLPEGATRDDLERAMQGKILEKVSCNGTYAKS